VALLHVVAGGCNELLQYWKAQASVCAIGEGMALFILFVHLVLFILFVVYVS
jgi:hypothetical protein